MTSDNADEIDLQREFNAQYTENVYRTLARRRGDSLVQLLATFGFRSVLDIGARNGDTLIQIRQQIPGLRLVGVDLVPDFLADLEDLGIESVQADAMDLPFQDQSFDVVFSSHTLEHCRDARKALEECFRIARKAVMIVVPIEDLKTFESNLSHHFHAAHPADWWILYTQADPERRFIPTMFCLTQHSDIEMLFLRPSNP